MRRLTLAGEAGSLEAVLDEPEFPTGAVSEREGSRPATEPRAACLLCHPLPPGGGTMHTHAVYRAMQALRSLGAAVLRFNFRGVGHSHGAWSEGPGELRDGRAALEWLIQQYPGVPVIAGGFSFGSWVGMRLGIETPAVKGLLGLGIPYRKYDFTAAERSSLPKALVLADRDEFTELPLVQTALARMADPKRLWVVEGTTHLFTERLSAYEGTVREAGNWLLQQIESTSAGVLTRAQ